MRTRIVLALVLVLGTVPTTTQSPTDEQAIRDVLKTFYDGWNAHDPEMMVSAYAEDIARLARWAAEPPAVRPMLAQMYVGGAMACARDRASARQTYRHARKSARRQP